MVHSTRASRNAQAVLLAVAVAFCTPTTRGLASDDAGIGAFFRQQFGIGGDSERPVASAPSYGYPEDRPIIVRPRRTHVVSRRPQAKIAFGPTIPVSIYEDETLKAGDAIMTKAGVRVFLGGHGAPYTEADFSALADADGLPKQVQKALLVIDKAPRG